jgi:hypothetical protein
MLPTYIKVIQMRKLHNVRKMTGATAPATAPATSESNTIALHLDLQQFVGLAVDYSIAQESMISLSMAMKPFLARYIAAGYTSISSGPRGKGQPPKPKANELSYVEIKGLFDAKCANSNPPIEYSKEATASGKSQYSNAINQFVQNFKLALTIGEWGTGNSSRDKKAIESETAEPKEKSKKGTRAASVFDAKKIADNMAGKYTTAQMKAIIEELNKLIA